MRGYVVHHRSHLYDGVCADYYRNDPYVWFSPYLWSFCHLNQNPRIETGMSVLWLSRCDGSYACDLVFVVGEILLFRNAVEAYSGADQDLALRHFERGVRSHPEVLREGAKTYVADMARSFIPHPAVPFETEIDEARTRQNPSSSPLAIAWRRPSVPLIIDDIDPLAELVRERSQRQIRGSLPPDGFSPGQEVKLRT